MFSKDIWTQQNKKHLHKKDFYVYLFIYFLLLYQFHHNLRFDFPILYFTSWLIIIIMFFFNKGDDDTTSTWSYVNLLVFILDHIKEKYVFLAIGHHFWVWAYPARYVSFQSTMYFTKNVERSILWSTLINPSALRNVFYVTNMIVLSTAITVFSFSIFNNVTPIKSRVWNLPLEVWVFSSSVQ